mgnify:CR=1 FL=1
MKMRVRKKINWMKRMVAAGMAVCMVLTTPASALAGAGEGTGTQTISEEAAGESILDTGTGSVDAGEDGGTGGQTESTEPSGTKTWTDSAEPSEKDGETEETGSAEKDSETEETESAEQGSETEKTGSVEKETQQDSTDSAESSSQIDDTAASESAEQKPESTSAENEGQNRQDGSGAENQADAGNQTPTLTLEKAAQLAQDDEAAKDKLKVDANTVTITVTDGIGLILLSNVKPSEYKKYTINLVTTSGWDLTGTAEIKGQTYSFLGLGDDADPYEGKFEFDKKTVAENFSITTTKALFHALSTKADLDPISFSISGTFSTTTKPLLAEKLKYSEDRKKLTSTVVLSNLNSDRIQEAAIGGLIGTMEEGSSAEITFTNNFSNSLKVSGESHTGLFCNTMEPGASLTATFKNNTKKTVSVEATASEADAGGFVGRMKADSQLTIAGTSAAQVSSAFGNAGGLAGSVTDGKISVQTENGENGAAAGKFVFADTLTLKAGSEKAAGGLIGAYSVTKGGIDNGTGNLISYDLSEYEFHSIDVSGGKDVGGLFGVLKNTSISSTTVAVLGKTTGAITTNVTRESEVTNLGGLIGAYDTVASTDENSAVVMKNTLAIKGTSNAADSDIRAVSTGGSKASTTYGGVIGAVSGSSYVEIENVSASTADMKNSNTTSVGGLVGKLNDGFLNVGNVTITTADDNDLANEADQVEGHGGLIGHLVKGVLRLHGETNLENQKITTAYNHVGQIVGCNENGLIYALGNGNSLDADGKGWSLTRYSGTERGGSDIGNWGAVIRLGGNLSEGEDGVFTFDEVAHTVTINSSVENGTKADINGANQFAAYALAFEFSKTDPEKTKALKLESEVDRTQKQTVQLTGDVDLTNTGIIGIGKDNIEKGKSAQLFKGTLDGSNHTITLDIGATYGKDISGNDLAAGQLYAKRSDQRDTHYSLALIPFAGDVTISELTINGNVICKIPKAVNQEVKDIKYPAFVAGAIGLASGKTEFNHVTVNTKSSVTEEATDAKKLLAWQGGFLARCEGSKLTFTDCTWGNTASLADERNTDNHRIGGLAAEVMGGCSVTVRNTTLSGSITSASKSNANVGGLIAVSRGEDSNNAAKPSTIAVSKLSVKGETVTTSSDITSGGLLGYQWKNTNVKFAANAGVTISGSTLNACTAQFGGLVYQATGYWNATAKDSIVFTTDTDKKKNTFTGKSEKENPSGLLVGTGLLTETNADQTKTTSALYLEVGTWGSAADSAYKINEGAVALNIGNSEYFDELAGITRFDDAGNSNAVVSLAVHDSSEKAALIDKDSTTTNTYTGQIENYKNTKTRYYYNLDSYRKDKYTTNLKNITSEPDLVLWSAAQYAAENIRTWFREKITSTPDNPFVTSISGNLNLDGYSYYPVTPLTPVHIGSESNTGSDTNLTFAYDAMNTIEETNKSFSDAEHQHYLMQHGLLYNTSHGVLVNKTSFAGVVGKEKFKSEENADGSDNGTQYNSGALIYGSVIGNPISNIVGINLKNVTLDGIRVTGVEKGNDTTYAPLLINRIAKAAKLTVDKLSTSEKYMTGEGENKKTAYAATSLVGSVGDKTASKLTLSFSDIALDGRVKEDSEKSTSVWNNGTTQVEYHTTHTIFTRAILMEYFMYSSDGSGTYNFNSTDNKVTYGVELTNTETTGRNPDKQYQYYDADSYITDEKDANANEAYVRERYKDTNFLRYVRVAQNIEESTYELDINQKSTGLLNGCGTYGDPYIIEDALQLSSLASYISTPGSISNFQVVFNSKVLDSQTQTVENYHTQGNAISATTTGTDITYTWENNAWKADGATDTIDTDKATSYLLNAYYKIEKDITISAETFSGLGTLKNPFSGVIVGSADNGNSITVSMKGSNGNKNSFGGLIAYSRGSVVKDLTVDYSNAKIQMQAANLPGTEENPFFGGVIGYCMGGDTIIDHVSVQYNENTVSFSGNYEKLIAAGGYVGLVGGATHVTENTDYEKTGGGVVFRNMDNTTNTFTAVCAEAADEKKTVKMLKEDGTPDGKTTTEGGNYFYRNPYVGRVLDGYACAEKCTVNNTDKNYTIPSLQEGTSDLTVSEKNGVLNATVASAQGLWLLSAIVNSGAGAMDSTGSYMDVDDEVVDAYQYGKPRTATYEGIGTDAGTDAGTRLADEKYWGGNAGSAGSDGAKNRVSYLVKNYTTGTTAARLAGKSSDTKTATNIPVKNIPVNLTFSVESIDMTAYGNGFRGIGCSYGENKVVWNKDCSIPKVYRRNLLIKNISGNEKNATKIILDMNQNEYRIEYTDGSWRNQGAGVFVDFHFTKECSVSNLAISGNVKIGLFNKTNSNLCSVEESDNKIGVGGFAARTANSTGTVTFYKFSLKNIDVYGGTMTGGAIGYIDGYNNSKRNVTFSNWSIENVNVSKWVQNDGSSGGLVGWNVGYGTLEITRDSNEDVNIKNLKVTTISDKYKTAAAGGLVGACDSSSVSIENVNANNVTVTGNNVRDIGGLVAGNRKVTNINIDINVTVTSCVLHSIEVNNPIDSNEASTGGIIGYHNNPLAIFGVTMDCNSKINGQQYTGGYVGQSKAKVQIMSCSEKDTYVKSDRRNWIGGFIGYLSSGYTATFQTCKEEKVNILGRYVGGLVGNNDGNILASNVEFNQVIAVTKYMDTKHAGLLTGSTDNLSAINNSVKGYNILAESCKVGYAANPKVEDLPGASIQPLKNDVGFWIGISGSNDVINLTAVSASGTVLPQKDIGTQKGSATIIYAGATATRTYQPTDSTAKPSSSASPWVDVNPKSDVPFADGTVMTGNAAGTGTAKAILTELGSASHDSAYYWNVDDSTKASVAKLLSQTNDAYLTTYSIEENATITVDKNVDFPVLVVNNTADVDGMIWDYIAAMTNVSNGDTAKKQTKDITATSYKWDSKTHHFAPQTNASLSVSSGKRLSITPNAYDNQCSQFTLLDVTYIDPTDTTNTTNPHVFHLYIPVLVKKVLYINFKTRFLAGTDYCALDYPMTDTSKNHYATADFNEPLTALIEYSYEKETDWQSMLDNGENLLWYYDKVLDLAWGSTGNTQKLLPEGTKLTLVDRQTKQYYIYTTGGNEDLCSFNLANMTVPGSTGQGQTPQKFAPVYICDLLGLKADPVSEPKDGTTYYVKETDPSKATVRIGADYYRKAEEKDKDAEKYRMTIPETDTSLNSQEWKEEYYLTIQIPKTDGVSIVNNRLYAATMSRKEGTLPAVIKSDKDADSSAYVVYNGVQQKFSISTSRIHNGSPMGDTAMENGDGIKIKLTGKLWLTEAGRAQFKSLGPSEVYHEFDISLKKYLENAAGINGVIGTENIQYIYQLSKSNGTKIYSEEGKNSNVAGLETMSLRYGSSKLKSALEEAGSEKNAITVTAEITLTYDDVDGFPVRGAADTDSSGTFVVGVSRIANTSTQLPITENKKPEEDKNKNRYYITNPSKAILRYSSVDGSGIGDTTQQLGVNPSDAAKNRSDMIYTRADYDYSNVDTETLSKAAAIRYKMELFQKNENGTYDETKPLEIGSYLQNIVKDSKSDDTSGNGDKAYQWKNDFVSDDTKHQFAQFTFTPLTGGKFEKEQYTYANYRVRLTAVLLDKNGSELDGTKATDYIIYTNARIYQDMIDNN